jgi:hypothetical protein
MGFELYKTIMVLKNGNWILRFQKQLHRIFLYLFIARKTDLTFDGNHNFFIQAKNRTNCWLICRFLKNIDDTTRSLESMATYQLRLFICFRTFMDKKPKRAKKGLVSFGPGFCTAGVK